MAKSPIGRRIALAAGLVAVAWFAAWFVAAVNRAQAAANQAQCLCHVSALALLLANYEDKFGSLPPAHLTNDKGEKLCSWRVLVLAADDAYRDIHESYDFSQPWDGPSNRGLAEKAPSLYVCPNSGSEDSPFTSYLAVTGPGTAFDEGRYVNSRKTDHPEIVIIESADSGVNWMEPRDLEAADLLRAIASGNRGAASSRDPQGPAAILSDGARRRLGPGVTLDEFKAMIAPSRGKAGSEWSPRVSSPLHLICNTLKHPRAAGPGWWNNPVGVDRLRPGVLLVTWEHNAPGG